MTYDLTVVIDDLFSFEDVSEEGNSLIEALSAHQAGQQVRFLLACFNKIALRQPAQATVPYRVHVS